MTTLPRLIIVSVHACSLTGCLFKEPVFTEGFSNVDGALGGVWVADDEHGDPRETEFAVSAPLDEDRYVLHHPAGGRVRRLLRGATALLKRDGLRTSSNSPTRTGFPRRV